MTKTLTPVTDQKTKNGSNRRRDWYYTMNTPDNTLVMLHSFTLKGSRSPLKMKHTELGGGF